MERRFVKPPRTNPPELVGIKGDDVLVVVRRGDLDFSQALEELMGHKGLTDLGRAGFVGANPSVSAIDVVITGFTELVGKDRIYSANPQGA